MHPEKEVPQSLPERSPPPPASMSEMTEMLGRLYSNFPERDVDESERIARIRGYCIAIDGVSVAALREAERRILRGEAGFNPTFMPTPPELALLCRSIQAEQRWIETRKPAPSFAVLVAPFDRPPDPAMVEKLTKVTSDLSKAVDIERNETRAEWLRRMGDRVKLLEEAAA
jgi:hypothetical protein